ncbi:MAG: response regulator [Desulfobacterales bacterium]
MTRLLLIDDEKLSVEVMGISLRSDGYEVLTASSGEEGLDVFDRESPDIVITDIKMPGMDGIEVLKRIKARSDTAEVIIITGHGDVENAIEALKYGASDFINKPVRDETLALALKRAESKISIRATLNAYTENLENEVERVTRELRTQSRFLEKLIKTSEEGIVATDRAFNVVIYNPAAEHILGYPAEEVLHRKKAKELFSQDLMRKYQAKRHDLQKRRKLEHFETQVRHRDGSLIPVRFTGVFLYEKGRIMGSVAFLEDLREIKRLQKELLMSERLCTVGQTVAGMAHGVKNILHGFKGGSYLMEVGFKNEDTEKLKAGWKMIQKHISRTSELVMDLLTYSKFREPEYMVCRPNDIVREVCQSLQRTAVEHNIRIVEDLDPAIGEVMMDGRSVHTILMNLISNALDACVFDDSSGKSPAVVVKTLLEYDRIGFEVTDNGMGMPWDVQEKIFTSFFSTKGHRGTGLGLLVTGKLIEEHNGTIDLWSEVGKGTRFTVKLPFKEPDGIEKINDSVMRKEHVNE